MIQNEVTHTILLMLLQKIGDGSSLWFSTARKTMHMRGPMLKNEYIRIFHTPNLQNKQNQTCCGFVSIYDSCYFKAGLSFYSPVPPSNVVKVVKERIWVTLWIGFPQAS